MGFDVTEYKREWRKRNPEKSRGYNRKWRDNHPEYKKKDSPQKHKARGVVRIWYQKNKEYRKWYLQDYLRKKKAKDFYCMFCGYDQFEVLDIHHVTPNVTVTLCANCHRLVHADLITINPVSSALYW